MVRTAQIRSPVSSPAACAAAHASLYQKQEMRTHKRPDIIAGALPAVEDLPAAQAVGYGAVHLGRGRPRRSSALPLVCFVDDRHAACRPAAGCALQSSAGYVSTSCSTLRTQHPGMHNEAFARATLLCHGVLVLSVWHAVVLNHTGTMLRLMLPSAESCAPTLLPCKSHNSLEETLPYPCPLQTASHGAGAMLTLAGNHAASTARKHTCRVLPPCSSTYPLTVVLPAPDVLAVAPCIAN